MLAAFASALLLAAGGAGEALRAVGMRADASARVRHTHEVLRAVDALQQAIVDAEAAQRGVLLTGDTTDRGRRGDASAVRRALARARALTADNPAQQACLTALVPVLDARLEELARTVRLAESGDRPQALAVVRTGKGEQLTRRLTAGLTDVQAEEQGLLERRTASETAATTATRQHLWRALGGALAAAMLGVGLLWREARRARRLAAASARAEARFRALVEYAPVGIIVMDRAGTITGANDAFAALVGRPTTALVGLPASVLAPADAAAARDALGALREGRADGSQVETRYVRPDGGGRVALVHLALLPGAAGGPADVLGVALDVTRQQAAAAALSASEARVQAALDGGRVGLVVLDPVVPVATDGVVPDFEIVAANATAAAMVGMPVEDCAGLRFGDLIPHARAAGHLATYAGVLATGRPETLEFRVPDPRFRAEWLRVEAVRLPDVGLGRDGAPAGRPGVALLVRDVSAEVRAARELRLLTEVTHRLAAAPDADAAVRSALDAMCAATGWAYGEAWFVTADDPAVPDAGSANAASTVAPNAARLVRGPTWQDPADPRLTAFAAATRSRVLARGEGVPGRAWADGVPVVLPRLADAPPEFGGVPAARTAGLTGAVAVPVAADGRVVAVLVFATRDPRQAADPPVALFTAVAAQAGAVMRQKLDQARLADREARLGLIYNGASDLMFLMRVERDAAGAVATYRCESVNAAYRAGTGLTDADLLGRTLEEILPPNAAAVARAHYADAIRTAAVQRYDETVDLPSGRIVVETTLTPVRDAVGAVTHLLGAARDVSALRRAEAALRDSEARHRALVEASPDGVFVHVGPEIRYVNPAGVRLLGAPAPAAVVGRTILEFVAPEERAALIARLAESTATGTFGLMEQELVRVDTGARVAVEVSAVPTRFTEGGALVDAVQATVRDITPRRRAEAALRENEARFRSVLDHLRAPAVKLDVAGCVTFVNDALLALVGWSREEVLGTEWFARFSPDPDASRAFFRALHAAAAADGAGGLGAPETHREAELLTRDGRRLRVAWDNVLLRDADGRVRGTASVGQDVTARCALEARLAALSEHDELTGLLNRRGFRRMADHARRAAGRSGRHDAVLCLDLDRFKPINDAYGHAAGDEALRNVAAVIRATLRDADFSARLGGDEFVLYAVGLRPGDGDVVAARLQAGLAAHNAAAMSAGQPFEIGGSVGVAELAPGEDLDAWLARGDAALYAQKAARKAGRA